jgi:hypothetical protein
MDEITTIFVAASAVVALMLVAGIASTVIAGRRNGTSPDFDMDQIFRILEDRETGS